MQNWGNMFSDIGVIGEKHDYNHHKNMNHVHRDSKDVLYVIITLETNRNVGNTVFYDKVNPTDWGN